MIDTISWAGKELQVTPMNPMEAAMVMFVLKPYAHIFREETELPELIQRLIDSVKEKDPADIFRLLAYMLHEDADALISEHVGGSDVIVALAKCFEINSVPLLTKIAYELGIWEVEVADA